MRRISYCISSRSRRSRAPSGSSISTRSGSNTSARAIATRCCWPPESWPGRRSSKPRRRTSRSARSTCSRRRAGSTFRTSSGNDRFCPTVRWGKERVVLEHHADPALPRRRMAHLLPPDANGAGGRLFETGEHHQTGRLAGARRPEQGQELALPHLEVETVHHLDPPVVALGDAVELDIRRRGRGGLGPTVRIGIVHGVLPAVTRPSSAAARRRAIRLWRRCHRPR